MYFSLITIESTAQNKGLPILMILLKLANIQHNRFLSMK